MLRNFVDARRMRTIRQRREYLPTHHHWGSRFHATLHHYPGTEAVPHVNRALNFSDHWTRWATKALLRRGRPCPYTVNQPVLYLTDLRPGYLVSSLIACGVSARAVLSHQQVSSCTEIVPISPLYGLVGVY